MLYQFFRLLTALVVFATLILFLTGCDDKEAKFRKFATACIAAKFTGEQCAFLFAIQEKASNDNDFAIAIGTATGAAGVAASAGRR